MFISTKRNNLCLLLISLLGLTSCCTPSCPPPESIEVPCNWYTPLACGVTEDPVWCCWWRAFQDPLLTALIEQGECRNNDVRLAAAESCTKHLEATGSVTAEIAQNYIELRGLQQRLKLLQEAVEVQNNIVTTGDGLLNKGFISLINQNENRKNLDSLLEQKTSLELSIKKTIFHLSALLSYPPGSLYDTLCQTQDLPELCSDIPVGVPMDLIQRHPAVVEAQNLYQKSHDEQALYNYQKTILSSLEEAENALAAYLAALDKIRLLECSKQLKSESYQLTNDLFHQGLVDESDALKAHQEYLIQDDALIQGKVDLLLNYVNLYRALQ